MASSAEINQRRNEKMRDRDSHSGESDQRRYQELDRDVRALDREWEEALRDEGRGTFS